MRPSERPPICFAFAWAYYISAMLRPMPAYFLISIPRAEQSERKSRIGKIFFHPNFVYMTRGMQCGQIIAIGDIAAKTMPTAKVGDTLLIHHFVESTEKVQCIYSDEWFNYYVVTCKSHNGQNNQTYAVFDGLKISPHPDYIFLDCEQPRDKSLPADEYVNSQLQKRTSGLFTFKEWSVNREEISKKIQEIKSQIDSLNKTRMNEDIRKVIIEREAEMNRLSSLMTKQRFQMYTIAAGNTSFYQEVGDHYGVYPKDGDIIYMLNIACETKIEFNKKEYIVAKTMHFGAPHSWVVKQINRELAPL